MENGLTASRLMARSRPASHRWKVLGVGFAANASFSAAFSGIPMTAVYLRSGYHLGNDGLGFVLGMLGLGIAVSELPWGLLTDRWGDRRVLLLGLLSTAAALAGLAAFAAPFCSYVPHVATLALGLLLVGLLGGSVNGSSGRAVMAWFQEGERGLAMSIRQTAVPAGGGLGALLLPVLAARFGFVSVYAVLALACAITAAFAWQWLHEPTQSEPRETRVGVEGEGPPAPRRMSAEKVVSGAHAARVPDAARERHARTRSPLREMGIWRVALAAGALCVPQLAVVTFGTVFLHDFGHANVLLISIAMAAVQIGAGIARVWSGRWTDRRGNRRAYMRGCSLLTAVLFAALALATAVSGMQHAAVTTITWLLASMTVLGGVSASAWHGVAFTELATLAGTKRAGTALAIGNTCVFLTLFLTPLAIPPLLSLGSWPLVWAVASVSALIALPVFPQPPGAERPRVSHTCDAG
ncbi:MFS transporter [Paraburkholderia phenoliruptrix]|uniref:MFS transporter n=1 Tax=Paraburkholderia phenoliruptrix TaxID=252970 RepID=UPI001C6F35BF|nr:MFS transporter [Paraburkholderia phenoliruptrix]MBW9104580.1 MFS transporter [Paraburkholderia phenoliruptrix]MBW9129097.1 MFS transporter [Paraburkholderia ginsengiterrae]